MMGSQQEEWLETPYTWLFLTNTLDFSATTIAWYCLVEEEGTLIWCQHNIKIIPRPQTNEIRAHAHRTWRQNKIGLCRDLTKILYWCQDQGIAWTGRHRGQRKKMPGRKQNKMCHQPTESLTNKSEPKYDPLKLNEKMKPMAGGKESNGLQI